MKPDLTTQSPSAKSVFAVKAQSWLFITVATAVVVGLVLEINKSVHDERAFFNSVFRASGGLLNPTLLSVGLTVIIVGGLLYFGKLSFRDFGWKRENLAPAIVATLAVWAAMEFIEVIANIAINGDFRLSASWGEAGAGAVFGVLIAQAVGIAPAEETFFRGFLLPQLRLKFAGMSAAVAIGLAIVVSQLIFSLHHLPNLILGVSGQVGTGFGDIVTQLGIDFLIGVLFAGIYIRTGNLFLVMGIHALLNSGTSVVATPIDPAQVILVLGVMVFLGTLVPAISRRIGGPAKAPRSSMPAPT